MKEGGQKAYNPGPNPGRRILVIVNIEIDEEMPHTVRTGKEGVIRVRQITNDAGHIFREVQKHLKHLHTIWKLTI